MDKPTKRHTERFEAPGRAGSTRTGDLSVRDLNAFITGMLEDGFLIIGEELPKHIENGPLLDQLMTSETFLLELSQVMRNTLGANLRDPEDKHGLPPASWRGLRECIDRSKDAFSTFLATNYPSMEPPPRLVLQRVYDAYTQRLEMQMEKGQRAARGMLLQ
jgi:hypothetical protein